MHAESDTTAARLRRTALPAVAALALAVVMTWPLTAGLGSLGRTGVPPNGDPTFGSNADGMFSLWNVSWVAHTMVGDPANLYNANIFYPHKNSLAYSEANIVAGVLGSPVWWATKNPYATLNFVILIAFASAWLFMWMLVRYLTGDSGAAAVAGILFAFCPYVFAHTAHIQLMMTGGIPLSMLMLHRLADAPSARRGIALGFALLAQALACAYYGIFAALMVGNGVIVLALSRSLVRNARWWTAVAVAAAVSITGVAPFFAPYAAIQQEGFARTLEESAPYSANAASYLASSAYAHGWLLRWIESWPRWNEVMFPGFLALGFAAAGMALLMFTRRGTGVSYERETAFLYGSVGLLAFWTSFGPAGGLYKVLFHIPVFSFLRAPSRIAIVVVMCLGVLGALALVRILKAAGRRRTLAAVALSAAALAELATEMPWERALVLPSPYETLAKMPPGPLAEFPFYGRREAWHLNTQYMLFSTAHWMPMLNGYSDHTPVPFRQEAQVLDSFPSDESFQILEKARVRYLGVHWARYGPRAEEIRSRLGDYRHHLRPLAASTRMSLYEIISFP